MLIAPKWLKVRTSNLTGVFAGFLGANKHGWMDGLSRRDLWEKFLKRLHGQGHVTARTVPCKLQQWDRYCVPQNVFLFFNDTRKMPDLEFSKTPVWCKIFGYVYLCVKISKFSLSRQPLHIVSRVLLTMYDGDVGNFVMVKNWSLLFYISNDHVTLTERLCRLTSFYLSHCDCVSYCYCIARNRL